MGRSMATAFEGHTVAHLNVKPAPASVGRSNCCQCILAHVASASCGGYVGIFADKSSAVSKRRPTAARIVVKFAASVSVSPSGAAEAEHAAAYCQPWEELLSRFAGVALRPFFAAINAAALDDLERRANAAGLAPRLGSYFAITIPHGVDATAVAELVSVWSHVELAITD
jgi:hypothetical protein